MMPITSFNDTALTPEERARVAGLSPKERQDLIKSVLVRYPGYKDAYAFASRFHRPVDGGTHDTGNLGALLGESRAGKSFMLQDYAASFPMEKVAGAITRPVVYIEIKNDMTPYDVASYLHFGLGYRSIPKVKTQVLMDMAIEAMPDHRVELVIFDDVDNCLTSPRASYVKQTLGFIKGILDSGTCNVLCSGRVGLYGILNGIPQIAGRGGLPHATIMPYRWRIPSEREKVRLLLNGIDNRLPFRAKSDLGSIERAAHFYDLSGGLIGLMMNIIKSAAYQAINDGSDRIENDHLVYASKLRMPPGATFVHFQDLLDPERVDLDEDEAAGQTDGESPSAIRKDMFDKKRPRRRS
ncbi:AAA family ATPase [Methylorubrum thiocyanatum]|uniref:AAA family ATPase n=1 Tax=Methylorubrum thiocyanatum TaxID=47958 RepID=UPI0035C86C79